MVKSILAVLAITQQCLRILNVAPQRIRHLRTGPDAIARHLKAVGDLFQRKLKLFGHFLDFFDFLPWSS